MSQTERINQIVHILESSRFPVRIERFLEELEVSRATFKRDIAYLRDRLGVPVEWQTGDASRQRGYVLAGGPHAGVSSGQIQGIWFNESEIHALLTMHRLASDMDPGLVSGQAAGLVARIKHLLARAEDDPDDVMTRIRILHSASFRAQTPWFQPIARATMRRRRLSLTYFTRGRGTTGARTVSPQRLLHYRENWYLLAWCHKVDALRLFALDAVRAVEPLETGARRVAEQALDRAVGGGFGIFGGPAQRRARLRFSAARSRWVRDEVWHRDQRRDWDGDHLLLDLPYSHEAEIAMEILRHGPEVEVLGPPSLRHHVADLLKRAARRYAG